MILLIFYFTIHNKFHWIDFLCNTIFYEWVITKKKARLIVRYCHNSFDQRRIFEKITLYFTLSCFCHWKTHTQTQTKIWASKKNFWKKITYLSKVHNAFTEILFEQPYLFFLNATMRKSFFFFVFSTYLKRIVYLSWNFLSFIFL